MSKKTEKNVHVVWAKDRLITDNAYAAIQRMKKVCEKIENSSVKTEDGYSVNPLDFMELNSSFDLLVSSLIE